MAKHPVSFWEINAEDAEPLANFYKRVLDWEISFHQQSGFYSINSGGGTGSGIAGGIFTGKGQLPPHRALYVEVEDIDEIVRRVPRHGGKVALEPYAFEGVGRLAFFRDPEGHMIGLIQRQHKTDRPEEGVSADEPAQSQAQTEPAAAADDAAEPEESKRISVPTAHVAEPPDPAADPNVEDTATEVDAAEASEETETEPPADPPSEPPAAESEASDKGEPETQE